SRGFAAELIQAHRDRLAQVHRAASIDAHQPVAIAEIVVRQTELLRTEQQRRRTRRQMLSQQPTAVFERSQRMLELAMPERCGANYQCAAGDRLRKRVEFFRRFQNFLRVYRGAGFTESDFVRIHQAKLAETEVADGARSGAYV